MAKLEKIWYAGVIVAALGIIAWWYFGFKDNMEAACVSFFVAGSAAAVALCSKGLHALRSRNSF